MVERRYTLADHVLMQFDQALRTLTGHPATSGRGDPAADAQTDGLNDSERARAIRLMRVNHTGEVCAQALYQGQAVAARTPTVRKVMESAAVEEGDHLVWCDHRIRELGGRPSVLNPLFYGGSLLLGALAARAGDRWSLGFLAETEHQVEQHLDRYRRRLPPHDNKSRAVLATMHDDERHHANTAEEAGGRPLPWPLRLSMKLGSKLMTRSTYWV